MVDDPGQRWWNHGGGLDVSLRSQLLEKVPASGSSCAVSTNTCCFRNARPSPIARPRICFSRFRKREQRREGAGIETYLNFATTLSAAAVAAPKMRRQGKQPSFRCREDGALNNKLDDRATLRPSCSGMVRRCGRRTRRFEIWA
jgi:hypothetical protein